MNYQEIYEARLRSQTPQEILEQQELAQRLQEAADLQTTQITKGWTLITKRMDEFVDEARASCEDNLSADPRISHALQIRLQQRKAVVQGIQQYVDEMVSWRTGFLNPDKEPE
jgi:hypothetical protein